MLEKRNMLLSKWNPSITLSGKSLFLVVAQFDLCTVALVPVCFFVNQNVAFGAENHHKTV